MRLRWYSIVAIALILVVAIVIVIYYPNLRSLYWGSNGLFNGHKSDTYIAPVQYAITWIDGVDNSVLDVEYYNPGADLVLYTPPVHEGYEFVGYGGIQSWMHTVTADAVYTLQYKLVGNTLESAISYIQANRYTDNQLLYNTFRDYDYYNLMDNGTLEATMDYYTDKTVSHMYASSYTAHYDSTVTEYPNDYVEGTDGDYRVSRVRTGYLNVDCIYVDDVYFEGEARAYKLVEISDNYPGLYYSTLYHQCDYLVISSSSMLQLDISTNSDSDNYFLANTLVFVADALVDTYKSDSKWSQIADHIYPISDLEVDYE